MAILVKICGLSTAETLDVALDAGADMVGFVFFPPSPRNVSAGQAQELAARVKGRAQKVVLSVDADDALHAAAIAAVQPDLLQLHGKETQQRVTAVKARFNVPVMKVIAVETKGDLAAVADYASVADRLLFDARAPRQATRPGGLGKAFDWHLLDGFNAPLPFMLSGGLDPSNVADALRITRAGGVDVSSGVERAPGVKDPEKIRDFIRAARDAAVAGSRTMSPA
jgi:phosphoribosylanthranilate isomerase